MLRKDILLICIKFGCYHYSITPRQHPSDGADKQKNKVK